MTRTVAAAAAAGFLALGLAACGGGSDDPNAEAFCKASKSLESQATSLQSELSDPDSAEAALQKLLDGMDVEAPKAIAGDWAKVKDAFTGLQTALKDAASADDGGAALQEAAAKLTSSDYSKAADNVDTWTAKNCK